jgi:integrase
MQGEVSQNESRRLVKTGTPGVYKRGGSYVVIYRDPSGKQRKRAARTLAEARAVKSSLSTDVRRGEWREQSRVTFADHWPSWIATYSGRTSRGFREATRQDYRRDLERFAVPFFGRMMLGAIAPSDVKRFTIKLAADGYAAGTIRNVLAPLRAMLADAAEEGIIRANPAAGVRIPSNARQPEAKEKALTTVQLERLRSTLARDEDVLLVDFLVASGQRISEAMALDWSDVNIAACRVRIERRQYRGIDSPKSQMSRRTIKISPKMAQRLLLLRESRPNAVEADPVFLSPEGSRLNYANVYNRTLKPAMLAAGIEDGAFHRLRHTCGTELRRRGATLEEIQLHLGHHDMGFTRRVYVHLDHEDGPDPTLLDEVAGCAPAPRRLKVAS